MRSKGSLAMMEELVMLAVFALAAALCLQAFVKSDQLSKNSEARDRALTVCQTVAETIRSEGSVKAAGERLGAHNVEDSFFMLDYGADWSRDFDAMAYGLGAYAIDTGVPGLAGAEVWVKDERNDDLLCRLEISWQGEVDVHG